MLTENKQKTKSPLLVSLIVFLSVLGLTQYLSYQEYLIAKKQEREVLTQEMGNKADKFRSILYNDITAANAIAIIYREYGFPKRFDSLASMIMQKSKYVEAVSITQKSIIADIYPRTKNNLRIVGADIFLDSTVKEEVFGAMKRRGVYFAGPRKLVIGGEGIWADVPVFVNNELVGFNGVLTRLPAIKQAMGIADDGKDLFSYVLKKKTRNGNVSFSLNRIRPQKEIENISMDIEEGDWTFEVAFSENHVSALFPYSLSVIGIVLSIIAGLLIYRWLNEPILLRNVIRIKTHEVQERVKELTTIYRLNELLLEENIEEHKLFSELVRIMPEGWQYPELCECRISFNGGTYMSDGFKDSDSSQVGRFSIVDGRLGIIEVIYTQQMPDEAEGPFLKEERDLINSVSEILKIHFNKTYHQQALSQSEARFRGAFEHSAIGMALVSLDGKLFSVNKGLCDMFGYTEKELASLTFQQITHPEDLGNGVEFLHKAKKGEINSYSTEKRYIHKNGGIVWARLNSSMIRDEAGNPMYFVSQIENITETIESQHKFRDLVEKSLVGVYIVQNNRFAYVNPRMAEIFEYTQEEMTSSIAYLDIVPEENIELVQENIQSRLRGEIKSVHYEIRGKTKNGRLIWMDVYGTATLFNGAPAVIGTLLDITEHRKSQEDLKKRESELRAFFDNIEGAACLLDSARRYVIFNQRFVSDHKLLSGHTPSPGQEVYDFLPPEARAERYKLLDEVLGGEKKVIEAEYARNGRKIYYRTSFSPVIVDEKVIGISTYSLDLTESKEAEYAIREAEMKFRDLVEKSPVGVYIFQDRKFAYVNPTMCSEYGYSEEELMNLPFGKFIHPDDLGAVTGRIELRLKGNLDETRHEIRAYRKNGEITWLEIYGAVTIYQGAPAIIGTMVNVTARKRLELEREKIVADLLQRNRDLEQFSYIVSHNIRGPVATLLGLGSLLQGELPDTDKNRALSGLLEESRKLDLVVKDVSSILNVKKNLLQSKTNVRLENVVRRVLSDLQSMISSSGAIVQSDFTQADNINSIGVYVHSIFLNLISNAIKYSEPGKIPGIKIWSEKHNDFIKIFFQDNGMGFDLEKYGDQVFGLYKRFNLSTEGKGMGLFMVKTQVGALNGTIELKSKPGHGSIFIVTLPL